MVVAATAALGEAQAARGTSPQPAEASTQALAIDDTDWSVWFDLALASSGRPRSALSQALRLNPLSPEIASWRAATTRTGAK